MNAILHALMPPKFQRAEPTPTHVCEDDNEFHDRPKRGPVLKSVKTLSPTLTHDGLTLTVVEWARRQGMSRQTLHKRLSRGWSTERALGVVVRADRRTSGR